MNLAHKIFSSVVAFAMPGDGLGMCLPQREGSNRGKEKPAGLLMATWASVKDWNLEGSQTPGMFFPWDI